MTFSGCCSYDKDASDYDEYITTVYSTVKTRV